MRKVVAVLAVVLLPMTARAQDATDKPWCVSERSHDCLVDLHLKARVAMEDKLHECWQIDNPGEFGACLNRIGYQRPLFEDDRFKPLVVLRK